MALKPRSFTDQRNGAMDENEFCSKPQTKGKKIMYEEKLLQFFKYDHLPETMQTISKPFSELAEKIASDLPLNAERTAALRKLLEAKDCAVRASIFK